jgi:DnaJ-class molecular chaperone
MISNSRATEAARLLGVDPFNTTPEEVRAAFWNAAKAAHPDKGGAPEAFAQVTKAKDDLLAWLEKRYFIGNVCEACGGTGTISKMRGWKVLYTVCKVCNGSGYT